MIPLICGIVLGDKIVSSFKELLLQYFSTAVGVLLTGIIVSALAMTYEHLRINGTIKTCYFVYFLSLFFLFYGCLSFLFSWKQAQVVLPDKKNIYHGVAYSSPKIKSRSVFCEALVVQSGRAYTDITPQKVLLIIKKDSLALRLQAGDKIHFTGKINKFSNHGNPDEFDYAQYMQNKGFCGQVFLWQDGCWNIYSEKNSLENLPFFLQLRLKALHCRELFIKNYAKSGLSGNELALYSALTLGDRSDMPDDLSDIYATVGVTHVLALSGLHLCYLVMLIGVFLQFYTHNRPAYIMGCMLALIFVWTFCFIAGLPSSLIRASLMYSLMLLGSILGRKGFSVNSLAVAATLMLCIKPMWLFDVSFQLSFLAMCGILGLGSLHLPDKLQNRKTLRFISESLIMSFKAQLATAPLIAYLFHTFALYSAVATLLLSPFISLLLCTMPLSVLASFLPTGYFEWWFEIVTQIIKVQHAILNVLAQWPYATVEVYPSITLVILIYSLILWWICKNGIDFSHYVYGVILLVFAISCTVILQDTRKISPMVVFYHNSTCPALHIIDSSERSYLISPTPNNTSNGMKVIAETFWKRRLRVFPKVIRQNFKDSYLSYSNGLIKTDSVSVLMLYDNNWDKVNQDNICHVDYIFLCHGIHSSLLSISQKFSTNMIILDASLSWKERMTYRKECKDLGWEVYDIAEQGALKVPLK